MKVEIEKKVKIELDSEEVKMLIIVLGSGVYKLNKVFENSVTVDFSKQLKQELER